MKHKNKIQSCSSVGPSLERKPKMKNEKQSVQKFEKHAIDESLTTVVKIENDPLEEEFGNKPDMNNKFP